MDDKAFLEELMQDFIEQVAFSLDEVEEAFLELETSEDRSEELGQIFRLAHSIKGGASVIGLDDLAKFAHLVEDLLSILRAFPNSVDSDIVSILLVSVDKFKEYISQIRNGIEEICWETSEISKKILTRTKQLESQYNIPSDSPERADESTEIFEAELRPHDKSSQALEIAHEDTEALICAEEVTVNEDETIDDDGAENPHILQSSSNEKKSDASRSARPTKSTVKVDTDRIDSVMDLVGELVVIKSQLLQEVKDQETLNPMLASLTDQLDGMVRDLYDRSLSMRMTSLKPIFVKVQRILRDLSVRLDKPIDLIISGEGTEIDRTMIETLTDPLIHIARNAIDHGIENKSSRMKQGKSEKATVQFSAYQEGGNVIVEFIDDGGGIDPDKVKKKAVEKAIITEEQSTFLSDEDAIQLIFAPGFSTAAEVSDISGRGVGLDVVKSNLAKIKGQISIESKVGKGTRFKIAIPLTTAIIDGMILVSNNVRYILPIANIKELLKIEDIESTQTGVGSNVIFTRNKFIPIISLGDTLKLNLGNPVANLVATSSTKGQHKANERPTVVIVENGANEIAIKVDKVVGQGQFVIKSLGSSFEKIQGITGGSIMGDGKISLIIDVPGLERKYKQELPDDYTCSKTSRQIEAS